MSGVQSTRGHLATNGGLRGHSVDASTFPFVVVAQGNPHKQGGLCWRVLKPDGTYQGECKRAAIAGALAAGLKRMAETKETEPPALAQMRYPQDLKAIEDWPI